MPNVAELITEHVTLDVKCVDRLYLNGYVPRLQSEGGVVAFLRQPGARIPSPALFGEITMPSRRGCGPGPPGGIPWIEFQKGERKDDVVQWYRDRFPAAPGVVWWASPRNGRGRGPPARATGGHRSTSPTAGLVCVNHYYLYVDRPRVGPRLPEGLRLRALRDEALSERPRVGQAPAQRRRLAFTALDNGFLRRATPAAAASPLRPAERRRRRGLLRALAGAGCRCP